jgi:hypothetical protein
VSVVYVPLDDWIATIAGDYLRDFIPRGGAAVKFAVVPSETATDSARQELEYAARAANCQVAFIDAAMTKLHLIDHLFHEVARQVDWDSLAEAVVRGLLAGSGFTVAPDEPLDYRVIAEGNGYDEAELRRDVRMLLTTHVYRDFAMAQEFRIAMTRLCQARFPVSAATRAEATAIKAWLRGELRLISALKEALIFQRIARHNARDMVLSLAHWLRLAGKSGLVLTLDVARYSVDRRMGDGSLFHTTTAAMDAYEVLRQFIDATDELEGCLIVVLAPREFLDNPKRGLQRYDPLKLRIWDEVRDRHRANPLASLVRLRDVSLDRIAPSFVAEGNRADDRRNQDDERVRKWNETSPDG